MSFRFNAVSAILAFGSAVLMPQVAQAQTYQMEILQPLHNYDDLRLFSLDEHSVASGINIVGSSESTLVTRWKNAQPKVLNDPQKKKLGTQFDYAYRSANKGYMVASNYARVRSVLWRPDGSVVDLVSMAPEGSPCECMAKDVDDAGHVLGNVSVAGVQHAALWKDPAQPPILLPTKSGVVGADVVSSANNGWAVGWWQDEKFNRRPVVWQKTKMQDLGDLQDLEGAGLSSVNANGTAGGTAWQEESGRYLPFLWRAGKLTWLAAGKSDDCQVTAVSDAEIAVGRCNGTAVIWKGDKLVQLSNHLDAASQAAGWYVAASVAINSAGVILAGVYNRYADTNFANYALLKPTAE
ncbi:MAG TPA: hypothetical protein VLA61_21540 [Ideonella sp.]|uniref:hypothetical protein n=1 Tax=Ideonella sp. TaxID=1929293 RepID=UPI002C461B89|nr:hypothetical protein [Ideonella sp.]HSI50859.1 hypothetical protein [Ideonella sp.]